jgi:hypothetical protein
VNVVDELARRRIQALVETALVRADVAGTLPTPLGRIAEIAGIREQVDIGYLPPDLAALRPSVMRRVLGALHFKSKVAFIDRGQPWVRGRFIEAHENGHALIPWHEGSYHLDGDEQLFRESGKVREAEANTAAALQLFQCHRFFIQALDYERSVKTPLLLADEYGASYHATIRYYAEHHPDPVALIIAGRFRNGDGCVPIWSCHTSQRFALEFGGEAALPTTRLPVLGSDPLPELARAALRGDHDVATSLRMTDRNGRQRTLTAEAFDNSHTLFLMLSPRQRLRVARRIKLAS